MKVVPGYAPLVEAARADPPASPIPSRRVTCSSTSSPTPTGTPRPAKRIGGTRRCCSGATPRGGR